jgi:adenylosuccinate synthase
MLFLDPISTLLDPKSLTIGIATLGLYISTLVSQFKLNDKISRILTNQGKKQDEDIDTEKERIKAIGTLEGIGKTIEDIERKIEKVIQYIQEKRIILDALSENIRETERQQTILATAQLNQTQQTGRVIDSLFKALTEHNKE